MHYIRVFKAPKVYGSGSRRTLSTTITIATDLGEDFYHSDAELEILVRVNGVTREPGLVGQRIRWQSGMRALPIEVPFAYTSKQNAFLLEINAVDTYADALSIHGEGLHVPLLLPIMIPFTKTAHESIESDQMVMRKINLEGHGDLLIWEETGESIARHIWYGELPFNVNYC